MQFIGAFAVLFMHVGVAVQAMPLNVSDFLISISREAEVSDPLISIWDAEVTEALISIQSAEVDDGFISIRWAH
ncbi:hypothetical protein DFH08DRAFT_881456, partial [Mycena albidolilacea]